MEVNCVIVDDEPMARQILTGYCSNIPSLNIVATCQNAFEASDALTKNDVDILFIDINMPVINGLDFIKGLRHQPQIILTTAHKEFALDGFELGVCDYLLKPIRVERFLKAVQKAMEALEPKVPVSTTSHANADTQKSEDDFLVLKSETKTFKMPQTEIVYLEASGNYTNIVSESQSYKIYQPLYKIEEELDPKRFLRIHRSYIVNIGKIRLADATKITLGNYELPIGRKYKGEVNQWIK